MEFEGMIYRILPPVKGQGARGEWTKQEVVFELPGEFSRKVCVAFWGDKAQDVASFREGEMAQVSINLESREHNGRWFTEARAWRITRRQADPQAPAPGGYATPSSPAYGQPQAASYKAADLPPMPSKTDEVDDLPF